MARSVEAQGSYREAPKHLIKSVSCVTTVVTRIIPASTNGWASEVSVAVDSGTWRISVLVIARRRQSTHLFLLSCYNSIFFLDLEEIDMVVIRLARGGAKKRPFYNMVVADSRARRDGRFIERIGFYNPQAAGNEQGLHIATDRLSYWQQQGAQASPTVARLLKQSIKVAAA